MSSDLEVFEKRRSRRRAALMQASIFHPHQAEHLGCSVRDISQDGALVDFPRPNDLPNIFWLRFDGEATLRLCTVAWRTEHRLGVEFSEQISERRRIERWTQARASSGSRPPWQYPAKED
jgi:PilZ domain